MTSGLGIDHPEVSPGFLAFAWDEADTRAIPCVWWVKEQPGNGISKRTSR
jgi:hypothetical protein